MYMYVYVYAYIHISLPLMYKCIYIFLRIFSFQTLKGRIAGLTPITDETCPGVENRDLSAIISNVSTDLDVIAYVYVYVHVHEYINCD
jgi:hypothetical protein